MIKDSKTDSLLSNPQALEDGIEIEKYIIATYTAALKPKIMATTMAQFAAIEQSTGNLDTCSCRDGRSTTRCRIAKVLGVYEVPNFEYEVPKEVEERYYMFRIAFPVTNYNE